LEFCLVAPIVILIMLGVLSFGLLFAWTNTLNNAAREGARAASVCNTDDDVTQKVINACNTLPNANTITVKITETDASGHALADGSPRVRGGSVTVKVTYITGPMRVPGVLSGRRTMTAQSTFRMECGS
jgi:Flp pilus assembly protein TadG